RWHEARLAYRRASDLDAVPMGVPLAFNARIRRIAIDTGAVFVDVARELDRRSPHRLAGNDVFVDDLHPSLLGNERIAAIIAGRLRELGMPVPASAWIDGTYRDPDPAALRRANPKIAQMERFDLDLTRFFTDPAPKAAGAAR